MNMKSSFVLLLSFISIALCQKHPLGKSGKYKLLNAVQHGRQLPARGLQATLEISPTKAQKVVGENYDINFVVGNSMWGSGIFRTRKTQQTGYEQGTVEVNDLATTLMESPEPLNTLETLIGDIFSMKASYLFNGQKLTFADNKKNSVTFVKVPIKA